MQHLKQVILDLETKNQWLCGGYSIVAIFCFLLGIGVMLLLYQYKSRSCKYYNTLKLSH